MNKVTRNCTAVSREPISSRAKITRTLRHTPQCHGHWSSDNHSLVAAGDGCCVTVLFPILSVSSGSIINVMSCSNPFLASLIRLVLHNWSVHFRSVRTESRWRSSRI